ncbi:MAG: DnaB-like helicase C-terminal domain-containing protein [Bacteroidales bacterium]|nr:DnaB-like helicase C-terminal domain-containing protein [Bacteroidales bacterium]
MESIELPIGLTAVGGLKGEGKTSFCLKLANHLAQREKVLFISYQDYKEKIKEHLISTDRSINPGLKIRTDFEYFGLDTFVKLMWHLEKKSYSTVFIDNSDFLIKYEPWDRAYGDVDEFIEALELMHHICRVKVVFTINIGQKADYSRKYPMLRDFNSSRLIPNKCRQVLAIYRPHYHGYMEDEQGVPLKNRFDIYCLKNQSDKTLIKTMDWSNFESKHFSN